MTYTINKTDGSTLTQLVDGELNQTTTDLTLVGRNTSGYGQYINDNFVWLLENFANVTPPNNPIAGQLWFDTTENRLKVYDGTGFKVSGGTIVAPTPPSGITTGDIWIDSTNKQLRFSVGDGQTYLAGPIWSDTQGTTGLYTADVLDTVGVQHTVLHLAVGGASIGVFSKDSFTPAANALPGFVSPIEAGFNVSTTTAGIKFKVPVSQADSLLSADGTQKTAANFLSTTDDSATTGTISIQNAIPLVLGEASSTEFNVTTNIFQIKSNTPNQNYGINLLAGSGLTTAFFINSTTQRTGIYTQTPAATLDVNGDAIIRGDLEVLGNLTTTYTTNVEIGDKLIQLATTATPTNATADGGGISISAGTDQDKTFIWEYNAPSPALSKWTSSENLELASGKSFWVGGFEVLTGTSLGASITSAPGISSLGTLTTLQAGRIRITSGAGPTYDGVISYINEDVINGNIVLAPKGAGAVDVDQSHIINLATPAPTDPDTYATNKGYVDNAIKISSVAISLDTTGLTDDQIATAKLTKIFPVSEHTNGTIARVVCTDSGNVTLRRYIITASAWVDNNPVDGFGNKIYETL
jgi:hypothetical protein